MRRSYDLLVIGGGVIGLSIAWSLARSGASVGVIEKGALSALAEGAAPPGQATWASAGMLAPFAEAPGPGPFLDLALESLRLYPEFCCALGEASGRDVLPQGPGMIRLARCEEEAAELRRRCDWQTKRGLPLELLDARELQRLEPALSTRFVAGVVSSEEKHVPPRLLLQSLFLASERSGVAILGNCEIRQWVTEGDRAVAVETSLGSVSFGQVIFAAGAWTPSLTARLGVKIPVRPIRGQSLLLRCALLFSHTLYSSEGYLVPRADGRVYVGATTDDANFNSAPVAGDVRRLLEFAASVVPDLDRAPFESASAGLRPATPDHLPLVGPLPRWENAHVATGHYRNGILLTPVTARLMASWLLERVENPLMEALNPNRFERN